MDGKIVISIIRWEKCVVTSVDLVGGRTSDTGFLILRRYHQKENIMNKILAALLGLSIAYNVHSTWAAYQVDFWWLAKSNAVEVYYYRDDIMRCIIFREGSNGMAPVCHNIKELQTP